MKVRWTRRAGANLDREKAYIAAFDPAAATRTATRIVEAVERPVDDPDSGRLGRVPGTREPVVPGTPYIVPYRVQGDTVQILRVLHGARKWPTRF